MLFIGDYETLGFTDSVIYFTCGLLASLHSFPLPNSHLDNACPDGNGYPYANAQPDSHNNTHTHRYSNP